MKTIIFLIAFIIPGFAFSQKPFQGTVVYELRATSEKEVLEVKVHFGNNQIKITSRTMDGHDVRKNRYLLLYLDSGKVYSVSDEDKTYELSTLFEKSRIQLKPEETRIANYAVAPIISNNKFAALNMPFFSGESIFYKSTELYYPIPEKYGYDERLVYILDNHIVLGADIVPVREKDFVRQDSVVFKITARAISVIKESFGKDFFQLPNGYTPEEDLAVMDSVMIADSTMNMIDTVVQLPVDSTKNSDVTTSSTEKNKEENHPPLNQKTPVKTPANKPKKSKS